MDIQNLTITDIIEGYKKKSFSVGEIINSYIERIEKLNPELNAFITVDSANARRKAQELDGKEVLSPLYGVPFSIKDMFLTKGVRTTAASKVLENYVPQYSSTATERLENAGAISLGKLKS